MVGERETGNETYVINLIRGLASLDPQAPATQYLLYSTHPERLNACGPLPPSFARRRVAPATSALRITVGIPARVLADHVDVLHVTYIAPPAVSAAVVATVHDISYELYPETFSTRDCAILKTLVPWTIRHAQQVITVSESSRRDIANQYNVDPEKIRVVYQSIAPSFRVLHDRAEVERVMARHGITGGYLLAVGNLQPRKNLPRLVRAFAQAKRTGAYDGRLALVGKSMWRESRIFQEIRQYGLESEVIATGYLPEEDVVALYNGADAFIYPSIYEGFGLPPLEAMACGCPVITGNTSSLPEVVGSAGIMLDPTAEEELTRAIVAMTTDAAVRDDCIRRGLERVQRFSASAAARDTLDVYYDAADRRHSSDRRRDLKSSTKPTS
ncbi:MAG TPA: glycosyltransferase family 1 protein [Ktedonobacterales bacterium]|jgi:glycosyltransferase involved in cell wall biosynthesis